MFTLVHPSRVIRIVLWAVIGFALGLAFIAMTGGLAHADTVTPQAAPGATVTVSPFMIAIIGGFITPLLTGIFAKINATDGVKALVSTFFMAAIAVVTEFTTKGAGDFAVSDLVIIFFTVLGAHVGSWLVWWRSISPTNTSPTADLFPNTGFGGAAVVVQQPPTA